MGLTHEVQFGDNLISIARRYGTTVDAIARANGIKNHNLIQTGAILTIPGAPPMAGSNKVSYDGYTPFDPGTYNKSQDVIDAENKANDAAGAVDLHPDFTYDKGEEYNALWKEYNDRKDFNYDFNADALYQQYKDKYIKQGKMAMADVIGQASAMTGGYGNSYAQTVGHQAYQAQLENLNDVIPDLYQLALDRHNQKGQDMLNRLGLYEKDRAYKYGIDQDKLDRLMADRGYYQGIADNKGDDEYGKWLDMVGINQTEHHNAENNKYNVYRDSIEDNFTERELAMKEEQWKLEKQDYYNTQTPTQTTSKPVQITTKNDKPATVTPTETANTTKFISRYQTKSEFLARNHSEKEFNEYMENNIAAFLRDDRITESEALYLIGYYGLK